MENNRRFEQAKALWDAEVAEMSALRDPSKPRSVAQVMEDLHLLPVRTASDLLKSHIEDANVERSMDVLDVHQAVSLAKARQTFLSPVEPGQVFEAASGRPLGKVEAAPVGIDMLMKQLQDEAPLLDASSIRSSDSRVGGGRKMDNGEFQDLCGRLAAEADCSESREFYKVLQATSLAK
jgi:hypothetical protein